MGEHKGTIRRWRTSGATPSLTEFLPVYEDDDNVWWVIGCGDHMNLLDEALEVIERMREVLVEVVAAAESNTPTPGFALDVVAHGARRALADLPRSGRSET